MGDAVLRAYDNLQALMGQGRGWIPCGDLNRRTARRDHFRLWFRSPDNDKFRAVAMFCDFAVSGDSAPTVAVEPSVKRVQETVKRACHEAGLDAEDGEAAVTDFAVLLLRSDGKETLRQDIARVLRSVEKEGTGRFWAEMWHINNLQYNVLALDDVPRHVRLTEHEKRALPVRGGVDVLPCMLTTDPVARAMGLREGDVVRIHRKDTRFGESLYWRKVVDRARNPTPSKP